MINRGQLINERYEIIRSIGEGGMANVYLAQDTILDRKVAVKVLRGDLAEDEKFVRRFQREAIAASSLNDPNIVEVYDVGEDNGKYFIVMEYVEGKTLKQLIKKRGSLTLTEVVDIMLQLTSAISHAHKSYIIHRDIKPQNVIILEDGRVKIMDFGIAVALNSGEITQTNSVMGTVYYIPPEQANGNAATTKSDIYSLGILMFELLTGHVPFKGDNPVEVAIKHMKEKIPSICEYDPDMPQSLENIILKACAKNPQNRYASAEEMHEDLETALDEERFNEPKVIYEYPEHDFDKTLEVKPKRAERNLEKDLEDNSTKKEKKVNKALIIVASIITILILALVFILVILPNMSSKEITIPDVKDMTLKQAKTVLEDKGIMVSESTKSVSSDDIDKDKVVGTSPAIGKTVKKDNKVTIIVSKGTSKIKIEDYSGKDYETVKKSLEEEGITVLVEKKDTLKSDDVKEGVIISQDVKAGSEIGKGDTITFIIPRIYISYPNFMDGTYTEDDVRKFAEENELTIDVTYVQDTSKQNDTVIYQNFSAGNKVSKGDNLRIKVVKNTDKDTANVDDSQSADTSGEENQ